MSCGVFKNRRRRCEAHPFVSLDTGEARCSLCEPNGSLWTGRTARGIPSKVRNDMPPFFRNVCHKLEVVCERGTYARYDQSMLHRSDDCKVVGVHEGYFFGGTFESQFYSYEGITDKFFCGVNYVLSLKHETAGFVLSPLVYSLDDGEFVDEICVVNEGNTFDTDGTGRLGVSPVDRSPDLKMFSKRDNNTKWQASTYHTHPLVTKRRLGRHAPPSFEDGACFLRTLLNSSTHVVVGYSGMYTLRRLASGVDEHPYNWKVAKEFLESMAHHAKYEGTLGMATQTKWCELQRRLLHDNSVSGDLLSYMRSMPFETLHDIHCYLIVYMHLFRYTLMVDFHPYKFEETAHAS
ncbi:hypothetical protein CYMTET_35672 [Cymbomonas tetramitiformis]|uniref:Uncharacterized protein n=1 Tax=Cymbomonas tetramitiformis TaxID=36881 RepID=A0AAE0KP05_9CHLO|nr:hypothetical protein CYMTET_35672 [Cymbomonas tetramitiformis]|eukprot:gene302-560_t